MCSYISFEGDIGDKLKGENNVPGIKDVNRQGPEGEWLGIK